MKRDQVKDADIERLREVAEDIGSSVFILTDVIGETTFTVDGLKFGDIGNAIAHCLEVA